METQNKVDWKAIRAEVAKQSEEFAKVIDELPQGELTDEQYRNFIQNITITRRRLITLTDQLNTYCKVGYSALLDEDIDLGPQSLIDFATSELNRFESFIKYTQINNKDMRPIVDCLYPIYIKCFNALQSFYVYVLNHEMVDTNEPSEDEDF